MATLNSDLGKLVSDISDEDIFKWPIVTKRHEDAILQVLREGNMSGSDINDEFQEKYAAEIGVKYGLACNNGTAAIHCGFYGIGIQSGDEVICPSLTYWASVVPLFSLGATPVFADVDPYALCIDPASIESRITSRTKAIVVVHYAGMPADMDAIMALAEKHNLKVFEDCSHAHAALYKGKQVGTFGDASGFSLMSGKAMGIGEGGIMFTNSEEVLKRAVWFGHYDHHDSVLKNTDLEKYVGPPAGGYKYRMHQLSSAFGLVQLDFYKEQFNEIDKAMKYFCKGIDCIEGIKTIQPNWADNSTKGGWYFPMAHYDPNKFGGLSVNRFVGALQAAGCTTCGPGCNIPLHDHPLFIDADIYGQGRPTRIFNLSTSARIENYVKELPVTSMVNQRSIALPWFKKYRPDVIDKHIAIFHKVSNMTAL